MHCQRVSYRSRKRKRPKLTESVNLPDRDLPAAGQLRIEFGRLVNTSVVVSDESFILLYMLRQHLVLWRSGEVNVGEMAERSAGAPGELQKSRRGDTHSGTRACTSVGHQQQRGAQQSAEYSHP